MQQLIIKKEFISDGVTRTFFEETAAEKDVKL